MADRIAQGEGEDVSSEPKYETEPALSPVLAGIPQDDPDQDTGRYATTFEPESRKRSVTISLAGKRLAIKTDADDDYVAELANFVEQRIEAVRQTARGVSGEQVILLATLQLADELLRERSETAELKQKIREKSRSILDYIRREARL